MPPASDRSSAKKPKPAPSAPVFFETPAAFRRWLAEHHSTATELWVGFHKVGSGRPSLTWPQSVDEALCFGWIDGVRKSLDAGRYVIRFTPRRPRSIWSTVNVRRIEELKRLRRMRAAGLRAFEARDPARTGRYSFEQRPERMPAAYEKRLRGDRDGWAYFSAQAPWYQRAARWWILQAKREETRLRRLEILIRESARGKPVPPLIRPAAKK